MIEYLIDDEQNKGKKRLADLSVTDFTLETSRESPAPVAEQ